MSPEPSPPERSRVYEPFPPWDALRPIPSAPEPERSLERLKARELADNARCFGLDRLAYGQKDTIVRALAHQLRDPGFLRNVLLEYGTDVSLRFLADLVLRGRVLYDELPDEVLREYAMIRGAGPHLDNGTGLLRCIGLVFLGQWEGRPAVYLPDDLRRPYAQALAGLLDGVAALPRADLRRDLLALVARTPRPVQPFAPGLPTPRARKRLPTPGPDRVLELEVHLENTDVLVRRRVLVSYQRSLGALHEIVRIAFRWPQRTSHWFFQPSTSKLYAPPRRRVGRQVPGDEWKVALRDVLAARGASVNYVLDPPTHWVHRIVTRAVHAPDLVPGEPLLIEAENVHPPPDLGRPDIYASFLESWRSGDRDMWGLETVGPDFDPDAPVDVDAINRRLAQIGVSGGRAGRSSGPASRS